MMMMMMMDDDEYTPDADSRERLATAQRIQQQLNELRAVEERSGVLFEAIRNNLEEAAALLTEIITLYEKGDYQ